MLKSDLHIHTNNDPFEFFIKYNAEQLIDHASKLGFNVISIVGHNCMPYTKRLAKYAEKKGILLIPGVEMSLEKKHVLVYNAKPCDLEGIKKIRDLKRLRKNPNVLIIAAHPFFMYRSCLKERLLENMGLFDAIEYVHFYRKQINLNRKAERVAKRFNKPLVGNSDAHNLWQIDYTFSLIDSKPDLKSVISAIKSGNVKVATKPLPLNVFLRVLFWIAHNNGKKIFKKCKNFINPWTHADNPEPAGTYRR